MVSAGRSAVWLQRLFEQRELAHRSLWSLSPPWSVHGRSGPLRQRKVQALNGHRGRAAVVVTAPSIAPIAAHVWPSARATLTAAARSRALAARRLNAAATSRSARESLPLPGAGSKS